MASAPSFDIESKVDTQEVTNAVNNANKELQRRFDFKGIKANFEFAKDAITIDAPEEFQLTQMEDILNTQLVKRGIDILALDPQPMDKNLARAKKVIKLKQGIDQKYSKKIVAFIKDKKFKVQATIQGEQVRVSGKDLDVLQEVITALKAESFGIPLQFGNYRS
jgi:uncharacterized protein YajQ (UPF0234 family)